ncbi:MAG: hypothetical protein DRQ51_07645 [Gammaproteobacteria bacterium]|nr:MAG: hypothetical protein DRQ51_07645 [Gammaproteobacteria bacterium]
MNFDLKDQTIVAQNMSDGNIITKLMEDVIIENGTNKNDLILDGEWRYSQQTINEIVSNGDKIIISKIPFRPNRIKQGGEIKKMKNMLSQHHYQMNTNEDATNYLSKLLGSENIFDNSKPYQLVETFIKAITYHDKSSIILDFFAGSGTTGDAVMRLNAEDGGARKFILVQLDEKIDNKKSSEAYKFCVDNKLDPVISSITIERLNRAGDKIKQDFKTNKKDMFADKKLPDIGYKVFSATDKPQVSDDKAIKGFAIKNHRQSTADTLINMLVATCKNLTCSIQCIIKDKLYMADNEIYLLKNITTEKLEPYQNQKINLDGWADIDLQNYLNLQVNIKENIYIIY